MLGKGNREGVMHVDVVLMIVLAALAVWTEVDKLRKRPRELPIVAERAGPGSAGDIVAGRSSSAR